MVEFIIDQYDIIIIVLSVIISLFCVYFAFIFTRNIMNNIKELKANKTPVEKEIKIKEVKLSGLEQHRIKKELEKKYYNDMKEDTPYKLLKNFNPISTNRKFSYKKIRDWYRNKYKPNKINLINMELSNGFHTSFLVLEKDGGFIFNKKQYVLDPDLKAFHTGANLFFFDFHENYALPVQRKLPLKQLFDTMTSVAESEIQYATNPSTLEKFISSEIAKQVLKSAQLDEWMRRAMTMLLFILIIGAGTAVYLLYSTGAFQNIQGGLGL